ncbi:MAG: HAD hydrolase-like protein, partial [Bacteroidaceae bacterium]|nr:HAD hydrolase-like protein [Bacteroidaceae bacterium]
MKTLILDFDGTLADTARCITATFRATLREHGLPDATDAAIRQTIGLPLRETF